MVLEGRGYLVFLRSIAVVVVVVSILHCFGINLSVIKSTELI